MYPDPSQSPGRDEDLAPKRLRKPPEAQGEKQTGIGFGWWSLIILCCLGTMILSGIYAARRISESQFIDNLQETYSQISMKPPSEIHAIHPEQQIYLYYLIRGQSLTAQPKRLSGNRTKSSQELARLILGELKRPTGSTVMKSPLGKDVDIRAIYILDGLIWLDLSSDFLEPETDSPHQQRLALSGLINSLLLNDTTLQGIRLLIEGKPVESIWGWLDASMPLGPDLSLIHESG